MPSVTIGFIYYKVCQSFPCLPISTMSNYSTVRKMARKKRTNTILIGVSLAFFICWAPINIYNLLLDVFNPFKVRSSSV